MIKIQEMTLTNKQLKTFNFQNDQDLYCSITQIAKNKNMVIIYHKEVEPVF